MSLLSSKMSGDRNSRPEEMLVITDVFPTPNGDVPKGYHIRDWVDMIKDSFRKVHVVVPTAYVPSWAKHLSFLPSKYRHAASVFDYSFENVEVHFLPFPTVPLSFFRDRNGDLAYIFNREKLLSLWNRCSVHHAHFTWLSGYIARKLRENHGGSYHLTIHENQSWFLEEVNSQDKKYVNTWTEAESLIRVNTQDISLLEKYNENTLHIPNTVDIDNFKPMSKDACRDELGIPKEQTVLLHVGYYKIDQKNHLNLIDAVKRLTQENSSIHLYCIGGGRDEQRIREKVEAEDMSQKVSLVGSVEHENIPYWMNACDVFLLPSYSESFGIVQIEANACGKPVIATHNGGSEEVILDGKTGFLVEDPEDVGELATQIEKALDHGWNPAFIRKQTVEKYSKVNIRESYLDLYD